ncbi:MAG: DNRLRE domain-containing protein [Desulfarculaceae bacterium]|nr:DNRLRE domain-containing protein [Desulfarculaceae bacterium]
MFSRVLRAALAVGLLLVLAIPAWADSISFDYKSGITDTMLNKYSPNANYGDYAYSGVYQFSGGTGYESLMRFDDIFGDGKNQIPLDSTISNATLRLYLYTGSGSGERALYRMTEDWSAKSTWNSLGDGVDIGKQTAGTADATFSDPGSRGFLDIDVTASLQAWADGAKNLGWVIVGTGSNWNYSFYASSDYKSAGWRPSLSVNYSSPVAGTPEPGTLLLMGSAMAFLGWRRRRRRRRA